MADPVNRQADWRRVARVRRSGLTLLVLGQSALALLALLQLLSVKQITATEYFLGLVFFLLFAWISLGFWTALMGFFLRRRGGDRFSLLNRYQPSDLASTAMARTAIVMPICNEPVQRTFQGLAATYRDLQRSGQLDKFDFYLLSDSRNPEVWLEEQAAWLSLCEELGAQNRLFYRRRKVNLNFKSGNVADFLRRWGRHYTYMVVLDADSLMAGNTLLTMVRLMQREPGVGILQTSPTVVRARTLFARLQQFASQVYSPLYTAGLAAIQMGDASFWGHNAIIRIEPFIKHCGLRKLTGRGLFSGPIISHDFVEAAYMGRAGYEVWLEPGLGGSHEESPPTLEDELNRDKRWARGNLQHLAVMLLAPRLRLAHRLAFLNGIMAYLVAPLWLAFLVLTTMLALQPAVVAVGVDGLDGIATAIPTYSVLWQDATHPYLGGILLLTTALLLFAPRGLAMADVVLTGTTSRFGGFARLYSGVLAETVVAMALAPLRMFAHSRFVVAAVMNLNLTWGGQNRSSDSGWRQSWRWHYPGLITGILCVTLAAWHSPVLFFWSLPVAIPLILAVPVSVWLGRTSSGNAMARRGLLTVAVEQMAHDADAGAATRTSVALLLDAEPRKGASQNPIHDLTAFEQAVVIPRLNRMHQQQARLPRAGLRHLSLARWCQLCLQHGPKALEQHQLSQLVNDRQSLDWLHRAAWSSQPDSYWGQRIALTVAACVGHPLTFGSAPSSAAIRQPLSS